MQKSPNTIVEFGDSNTSLASNRSHWMVFKRAKSVADTVLGMNCYATRPYGEVDSCSIRFVVTSSQGKRDSIVARYDAAIHG